MLNIVNLNKKFNRGTPFEKTIFHDFNLALEEGTTALIGSNGCGKSTLLNLVSGRLKADSGRIEIGDRDVSPLKEEERSEMLGIVHQNPSMGVAPSLTILENMAIADKKNEKFTLRKLIRKNRIGDYQELLKTLDLGLENQLSTKIKYLSGGQRQSLSLLMATMKHPRLLLLDEHTAALDPKTSKVVMDKTKNLIKNKEITTLMVTHDMRDAVEYADRIIMLDRGKIILDKRKGEITETDLYDMYKDLLIRLEKEELE
ncbi:MAG: ATP-binding cassette domain-containing protein [Tissierellia bacterium]|nr:ATP-binding cassette domain-containing protein [Tissierellia bacterium]